MDKIIEFSSVNSLGQHFAEALDISPRHGGGLEKIAGQMHPEVSRFMHWARAQKDPRYQYVLMTPMGSFEIWGMNVNGDIFPGLSLSYNRDGGDPIAVARALEAKWLAPFGKKIPPGNYTNFGYKTFLEALRYRHHENKNPDIAYGTIVVSVWNPLMHRVEVIVRHDREKAKRVGAEEIIVDLDAGKPRQISMGCKVPFDVCTKCGHISRTPLDYCDDLKLMMGEVLPDGTIVGAVNFFPRFHDLSDVIVPAAKESGVLMKVARARHSHLPSSIDKAATQHKRAELSKTILPNANHRAMQDCISREQDIPSDVLGRGDFGELLTTLAALGIVLKPHEFQEGMLPRMGEHALSDELRQSQQRFMSSSATASSQFDPSCYSPALARRLSGLIPGRSGLYPHLPARVLQITMVKSAAPAPRGYAPNLPVLQKVASAYESYRRAFRDLPHLLEIAVQRDSKYYDNNFFQDLLADSLEKSATSRHGMFLSTPMAPLYFYNAHRGDMAEPPQSWELQTTSTSISRALLSHVL